MKAMIFAAGLGTRLKPLTDTMPKALVPVCGQPLLYHVLTKLVASGYDDIVVNVHHFPDQIIDFLRAHDFGARIAVSDERDFLRETGGGIRFAQGFLTDFSTPPSAPLEMTKGASSSSQLGMTKGTPSSSPLEMTKGASSSSQLGMTKGASSSSQLGMTKGTSSSSPLGMTKGASSSSQLGMTGVTAPSATLGMSSLELRRQDDEGESCQSGEGGAASRLGEGPLSFRPSEASGEICPSQEPFLVHNVDIISNLDLRWLREQHRPEALATLVVSERKTQRYFLFDEDNRLRGWTNLATGEVRSPFPDIDPAKCRKLAFAGIHLISPAIFPAFWQFGFGDRFSIVDFYLKACAEYPIYGVVPNDFRMVDVGKKETLSEAERVCEAILR